MICRKDKFIKQLKTLAFMIKHTIDQPNELELAASRSSKHSWIEREVKTLSKAVRYLARQSDYRTDLYMPIFILGSWISKLPQKDLKVQELREFYNETFPEHAKNYRKD